MLEDPVFNIRFVQTIQQRPQLYDITSKDYNNKTETEKVWIELSFEYDETVEVLKARWKNIRGCYSRHLRSKKSGRSKKPYYLSRYLKFLIPYMKERPQSSFTEKDHSALEALCLLQEEDTDNTPDLEDWEDSVVVSKSDKRNIAKRRKVELEDLIDDQNTNEHDKYNFMDFCRSLLPQVNHFSPSDMRLVRRQMLDIIDSVTERGET